MSSTEEYNPKTFWRPKEIGLYGEPIMIHESEIDPYSYAAGLDLSQYPAINYLILKKPCRLVYRVKKVKNAKLNNGFYMVTTVANSPLDGITIDSKDNGLIKQLCMKFKLDEPECSLQTMNNLVLAEYPIIVKEVPDILALARSSDEGDVIITAYMLLNHKIEIKQTLIEKAIKWLAKE